MKKKEKKEKKWKKKAKIHVYLKSTVAYLIKRKQF